MLRLQLTGKMITARVCGRATRSLEPGRGALCGRSACGVRACWCQRQRFLPHARPGYERLHEIGHRSRSNPRAPACRADRGIDACISFRRSGTWPAWAVRPFFTIQECGVESECAVPICARSHSMLLLPPRRGARRADPQNAQGATVTPTHPGQGTWGGTKSTRSRASESVGQGVVFRTGNAGGSRCTRGQPNVKV